jgi:L-ascorbate metabolism protein UlaG (beta-lactamase superfamily)
MRKTPVNYTLLRNAAAVLSYGGKRFLVDPCLDPAGARPPVSRTPNQRPNPLVDLPVGWEDVIRGLDALIVTHLHLDHFDDTAAAVLDHHLPIVGQPEDVERLTERGFTNLRPVDGSIDFGPIHIVRTPAEHGTGEIARLMAPVSGFMLTAPDEPTLYIAGDTVWCDAVAGVIAEHQPDVIVLNASGARFLEGDPIVMTAGDIARVRAAAPNARLVVVHLEAINHCLETREYYRTTLPAMGVSLDTIRIPDDGETVAFERVAR